MEKKDTAPSAAGKAREENAAIAYTPFLIFHYIAAELFILNGLCTIRNH